MVQALAFDSDLSKKAAVLLKMKQTVTKMNELLHRYHCWRVVS